MRPITAVPSTPPLRPLRPATAENTSATSSAIEAVPGQSPSTPPEDRPQAYGKAEFDPVSTNVQATPTKNFYVNGIRTPQSRADQARDLIADNLGQEVELLYNPSESLLQDGIEAWKNLSGFETEISRQVEEKFKNALDTAEQGQKIRVFAHSQGSAITADALRNLEKTYLRSGKSATEVEQIMSQIEVVGFGGFADYQSFPNGVNVTLSRNKDDHVPQLATASLAIGDAFREVQKTPKDTQKWWQLGKASLGGAGTLVKAVGKNVVQAIDSAIDNRDDLGRVFQSNTVNTRELEAYFAKVCATVESDHLAVICNEKGQVVDGYIRDYFDQSAQV